MDLKQGLGEVNAKIISRVVLWAKESYLRSIALVIIIYIFGFPLLQRAQEYFKQLNFVRLFNNLFSFIWKEVGVFELLFIILLFMFFYLFQQIRQNSYIQDKFNKGLIKWSLPFGASWAIQRCEDVWGNMVKISGGRAGILKGAYTWYDYEISFLTKFKSNTSETKTIDKIGIIVRAENNKNGILMELSISSFIPYIFYDGVFIEDGIHQQKFTNVIAEDEWVKVKIVVRGELIEVWMANQKLYYRIPSEIFQVEDHLLAEGQYTKLEAIRQSDVRVRELIGEEIEKFKKYAVAFRENKSKPDTENLFKEWREANSKIPRNTKVEFDFQKGSVGFVIKGNGEGYCRNLVVRKI